MGWLIALGVLIGIAILPLGVSVVYDASGTRVSVIAGPARFAVFPKKKRAASDQKKVVKKKEKPKKKKDTSGGSIKDFKPLLSGVLEFLGEAKGKLRVKRLEAKITLAGGDPADLAINYGRAWAAVGNVLPILERHLVIKKRNLAVQCDFTSDETRIYARLDVSITVARILSLGIKHGIPLLRDYLNILKLRKGGAKT